MNTQFQVRLVHAASITRPDYNMYCTTGHTRGCPIRIPNQAVLSNNQVARIDPQLVPTVYQAIQSFEEDGGHLTHFSSFGEDPLAHSASLMEQRATQFNQRYPSFDKWEGLSFQGRFTFFYLPNKHISLSKELFMWSHTRTHPIYNLIDVFIWTVHACSLTTLYSWTGFPISKVLHFLNWIE